MTPSFLDKLLDFYREDPNDPFNLYALALEYQKHDTREAGLWFEKLLTDFPAYLPAYYQAAQFFNNCQLYEKARDTYRKGIRLAEEQHNNKTLQELQRAYHTFEEDQLDW